MAKVYILNRLTLAGLQLQNIQDKAIYARGCHDLELAKAQPAPPE